MGQVKVGSGKWEAKEGCRVKSQMEMASCSPLNAPSKLFQSHRLPVSVPLACRIDSTLLYSSPKTLSISRRSRNAPAVTVRAHTSPPASADLVPDASFYKVEAILRPWRVSQVASALLKIGIRGVTVSDVRGFGSQGALTERQAGSEFAEDDFVAKVKMEIVVSKDQVDAVIDRIIEEARTGEIGDGKIFVIPVADVIRVRTGERGAEAERMVGGRADMISAESRC